MKLRAFCKSIKLHIYKPSSFHLGKMRENNIPFTIKYYLQKFIKESFPEVKNYLDNFENIKIIYEKNEKEFK